MLLVTRRVWHPDAPARDGPLHGSTVLGRLRADRRPAPGADAGALAVEGVRIVQADEPPLEQLHVAEHRGSKLTRTTSACPDRLSCVSW